MKILWIVFALLATLIAAVSVFGVGLSLADVYAITLGGIAPGDHMLGDRTAPTLSMALGIAFLWSGLVLGSIMLRRHALTRAKVLNGDSKINQAR